MARRTRNMKFPIVCLHDAIVVTVVVAVVVHDDIYGDDVDAGSGIDGDLSSS